MKIKSYKDIFTSSFYAYEKNRPSFSAFSNHLRCSPLFIYFCRYSSPANGLMESHIDTGKILC